MTEEEFSRYFDLNEPLLDEPFESSDVSNGRERAFGRRCERSGRGAVAEEGNSDGVYR
jgi:hypothetical protein